jgi:hypothetical protein
LKKRPTKIYTFLTNFDFTAKEVLKPKRWLNQVPYIKFPLSRLYRCNLKGLSHEIDFKNVDENGQILALLRAAAGF